MDRSNSREQTNAPVPTITLANGNEEFDPGAQPGSFSWAEFHRYPVLAAARDQCLPRRGRSRGRSAFSHNLRIRSTRGEESVNAIGLRYIAALLALILSCAFPTGALAETALKRLAGAWSSIHDYAVTIDAHEVLGRSSQERVLRYVFRKPAQARLAVFN
jgi:hypothetical protein